MVEVPGLGSILAVHLHHAEHRCVVLHLVHLQNLAVVAAAHILGYAPLRVEEVAYVHDVEAELQAVACVAYLHVEVVCPTEVEAVYERSASAVSLCVLTLVVLQILVLLYELPECLAVGVAYEVDFRVVSRYVHQVVLDAVAVDIAVVEEAVARRRVASVEEAEVILGILVAYVSDDAVWDNIL